MPHGFQEWTVLSRMTLQHICGQYWFGGLQKNKRCAPFGPANRTENFRPKELKVSELEQASKDELTNLEELQCAFAGHLEE